MSNVHYELYVNHPVHFLDEVFFICWVWISAHLNVGIRKVAFTGCVHRYHRKPLCSAHNHADLDERENSLWRLRQTQTSRKVRNSFHDNLHSTSTTEPVLVIELLKTHVSMHKDIHAWSKPSVLCSVARTRWQITKYRLRWRQFGTSHRSVGTLKLPFGRFYSKASYRRN